MLRLSIAGLCLMGASALGCGDAGSIGAGGHAGGGGTGGDGGSGGSGGTYIEPGPTCLAFCKKTVRECAAITYSEASCVQGCEINLAEERAQSEACGAAVEAWFLCVSDLDCQGVYDSLDENPLDSDPCQSKVTDVDLACPQN